MQNGDWLRRRRMLAGFRRQQDLAEAMGVGRSAVANWETNRAVPEMAHAEKLAPLLRLPRAEVLARFGYPIGGGEPVSDLPAIPPEWLAAMRAQVAAGVSDGIAQAVETLRREGLLGGRDRPDGQSRRRRSA